MPGELIEVPQASRTFRHISMDYSYFLGVARAADQRRPERAWRGCPRRRVVLAAELST